MCSLDYQGNMKHWYAQTENKTKQKPNLPGRKLVLYAISGLDNQGSSLISRLQQAKIGLLYSCQCQITSIKIIIKDTESSQ